MPLLNDRFPENRKLRIPRERSFCILFRVSEKERKLREAMLTNWKEKTIMVNHMICRENIFENSLMPVIGSLSSNCNSAVVVVKLYDGLIQNDE